MQPIRILQVVANMQQGGIENFIMNVYRNVDRTKVQFDFLVHYTKKFAFDDEIEKLGGKIYRLSFREDNNIIKYYKDLNNFFSEHKEYQVVHGQMASLGYIYLGVAKKHGVKIRIIHSHGASHLKTLKGYTKDLMFKLCDKKANVRFACSTEAGKYLFGKKEFEIIPNAIEFEKYKYNADIRNEIRKQLNIENKFVIGHIGRFNLQKNHKFIINFFDEFQKNNPNSVLVLVGVGELQEKIKKQVKELNIENKVLFLGSRNDANKIYNAFDCFILPSLFEGLPVAGIEAQVNGLPCFFSEPVTRETKISENVFFIDLKIDEWVKTVEKYIDYKRKNIEIKNEMFDIVELSKYMQKKYMDYYEGA